MRTSLVLPLLLAAACLSEATAQLSFFNNLVDGTFLRPDKVPEGGKQCTNQVSTTTVQDVVTTHIYQPVTIISTSTSLSQAVVSATQVVTTTMQQIESRKVEVPVTQIYEQINTLILTSILERPVALEPEVVVVTETNIVTTTLVKDIVKTKTTNVVRPEYVTRTQYQTSLNTAYETETRQKQVVETTALTPAPVQQTFTVESELFRTETVQLPGVTSTVSSKEYKTEQKTLYRTPALEYYTSVVQETKVNTKIQDVTRTETAYATEVKNKLEVVKVTDNKIDYVTSTETINENVLITESVVIDRFVTDTQISTDYVISTIIEDELVLSYVTSTKYNKITNYVTITEYPETRQEVVTRLKDEVQFVTKVIDNVIVNTINKVVTAPCETKTGYSYKEPKKTFIY